MNDDLSDENKKPSPDYIALVSRDFSKATVRSGKLRAVVDAVRTQLEHDDPDNSAGALMEALCSDPTWCRTESRDIERRLHRIGWPTPEQVRETVQAVIGERFVIVMWFLQGGDQCSALEVDDAGDRDSDDLVDSSPCCCPARCACQGTSIRIALDLSGTNSGDAEPSPPTCAACLDWWSCDSCDAIHCPVNVCPGPMAEPLKSGGRKTSSVVDGDTGTHGAN